MIRRWCAMMALLLLVGGSWAETETRRLHIVSHSHWDREWYQSFESFRRLSIELLHGVVAALDGDASLHSFHLDSQSVLVEDFVSSQSQRAGDAVLALVAGGRLLAGPWYTQPDEFLASPESLVRNLQLGTLTLRRLLAARGLAARFDDDVAARFVGYLPDQFGHVGQMPQLLRGVNVSTAVLMRGLVPGQKNPMRWHSADEDTSVMLVRLTPGYCGPSLLHGDPVAELRPPLRTLVSRYLTADVLLMNGCDHTLMNQRIGAAIADAHRRRHELADVAVVDAVLHSSLPDVAAALAADVAARRLPLPRVAGELRHGVAHLAGSLSSGASVKRLNWQAQRMLEQWAEPLTAAAWLADRTSDERLELERVWKLVLENHAHDTICTTSVPAVHDEATGRFRKAVDAAAALVHSALRRLHADERGLFGHDPTSLLVINPTNIARRRQLVAVWLLAPADALQPLVAGADAAVVLEEYADRWCYTLAGASLRRAFRCRVVKLAALIDVAPLAVRRLRVDWQTAVDGSSGNDSAALLAVPRRRVDGQAGDGNNAAPLLLQGRQLRCQVDARSATVDCTTGDRHWRRLGAVLLQQETGSQYLHAGGASLGVADVRLVSYVRNAVYQQAVFEGVFTGGDAVRRFHLAYVLPTASNRTDSDDNDSLLVRLWFSRSERGGDNFRLAVQFPLPCRDVHSATVGSAFDVLTRRAASGSQPLHQFVSACGLSVATRGLYEYTLPPGGNQLQLTLMRSVDRLDDWGPFVNEAARDAAADQDFQWQLTFAADSAEQALRAARLFNAPVAAVHNVDPGSLPMHPRVHPSLFELNLLTERSPLPYTDRSKGAPALPERLSARRATTAAVHEALAFGLLVEPEHLPLSSVAKAESRDAVIVRVYNPFDAPIDAVFSAQRWPIAQLFLVDLREVRLRQLPASPDAATFTVAAKKIVSLEFVLGK